MPKLYIFNPQEYGFKVYKCLVLITKEYYQMIWGELKETNTYYEFDSIIVARFNQEEKLEDFYSVNPRRGKVKYTSSPRTDWNKVLNCFLRNIKIMKELNPQQFLTHENQQLRKLIKKALEFETKIAKDQPI